MIYLIGGPPKCGKTTLTKKLSKTLGVSWISADTIQNIVKVYTPEKDIAEKFPSSNHRTKNNDERFSKYSAQELITDYQIQAKASYPAIRSLVETYLVDEDDFIIEGYQVTPELVHQLHTEFGTKNIKPVFLIKKDPVKFLKDLHKSTTPNDWILRRTHEESTLPKIAQMIMEYALEIEKDALKYKLTVQPMDEHFNKNIKQLITCFTKTISSASSAHELP